MQQFIFLSYKIDTVLVSGNELRGWKQAETRNEKGLSVVRQDSENPELLT